MGQTGSFVIKDYCSEEEIITNWIKTMRQYPYLYDYSELKEKGQDYNNNRPIRVHIEDVTTLNNALDGMIHLTLLELVKSRSVGKNKSALLLYD